MNYIPVVDERECLAHGDCVEAAPDVFELDDIAVVIGTAPLETILAAVPS